MATNEAIHPGEVECGSSLAEVAWTACIPSSDAVSPPTNGPSSTEDVHSQIRSLRSLLARDVIIDPPPNATSSIDPLHFPTFLSPLQLPTSTPKRHTGTPVPLIYCDHTASHRPLASIENYLRTTSLPCHANTHTNTTYTASQSTAFVAEARQILAEAAGARVSGKAALDCVLFGGNGVTGAVAVLIDALNLQSRNEKRPIVFVGPHEHHSNLIPWREAGCEVVNVPQSARGEVDLRALERMLRSKTYGVGSGRLRMGAFSAVSNVTGLIADVDAIAILLHRYHCLAFFDYASAAPYLKMNMNPTVVTTIDGSENGDNPSKDAIYFSPHKCYGGTSTPGVLIVKKRLLSQTNPPNISGGGTVFYVTNESHRFLSNRIERYEGGTPDGIGIQRAGLAMLAGRRVASEYERIVESAQCQENDAVTPAASNHVPKTLLEYECWTHDRVVKILKKKAPNLIMLGCDDPPTSQSASNPSCVGRHLPIFSFLIRCGRRFLHYNYVCAILNDVFGIQSRGGCQCAGPYSQRLLGLTKTVTRTNESTNEEFLVEVPNNANRKIEQALLRSDRPCELLRPGYTRLSLPFKGLREEEVEYVIQALIWTAKNAWALLPQYTCDHRTGEWRHWSRRGKPLGSERRWLSHYDILSPKHTTTVSNSTHGIDDIEASQARLDLAMRNADALLEAAKNDTRFLSEVEKMNLADGMLGSGKDSGVGGIDDTLDELRWYVYQQECVDALREGLEEVPFTMDKDALLGGVLREHVDDEESGEMELMPETSSSDMQQQQEHRQSSALQSSLPSLLSFQDGDHMGEASYEELKSGFDDGELSSECLIFHHDIDEWIPIVDFIKHYEGDLPLQSANGRKRDLSAMKEVAEVESMECEETPSCNGINSMKINPVFQEPGPTLTSLTSAAEKREKKKPSRKNSQWGQCSAPHIIDPTEQDNATGNEKKSDFPDSSMPHASSNGITCKQNKKNKQIKPPPKMMRFITQAMIQWDMIQEGDRLLLGLSGGKDSLSLLHCLLEFQRKLPIKFDIEVCTIDPMTPSFDPSPLIPYVESLGLKYHYIRDDIVSRASSSGKDGKTVSSLCAFCARMKRGNLYTCARKNNCNKLVLAQHLDDCAESFLMSVMHNGFIRTMKANYRINAGDVSVIRPLVYCRESLMTEFAKSANLPVINENCPACFEEPKERARVKKLLSREETLYPNLYDHIRRALIPIMHDDSTAIMRSYLEETISKSVKLPSKGRKPASDADTSSGHLTETGGSNTVSRKNEAQPSSRETSLSLHLATEEQLIAELAKRRAAKFQLSGAMKRLTSGEDDDPTGQVCSLTGGNGTIPCRELME